MKCPKCDGKGWYDNPKYPNPASWSDAGVPTFKCGKCRQTGYIIGNAKDVIDFLVVLEKRFERDKETLREIKQCIKAIEG